MRLWSIHPKYLDKAGLIAAWREALLAQSVLIKGEYSEKRSMCYAQNGQPKGYYSTKTIITPYYNHPQLERFKKCDYPLRALGQYLTEIYEEAKNRGYKFDANKIEYFYCFSVDNLTVTTGQLEYELNHLQNKLWLRDKHQWYKNKRESERLSIYITVKVIEPNPIFKVINGQIESWEKVK